MSTILQIVQDVEREIGITVSTTLVSSSSSVDRQLLALAHDELQKLRVHEWGELTKLMSITLSTNISAYTMPQDFDYFINKTAWDQANDYMMLGPLTPQEWQAVLQGNAGTGLRKKFRISGFSTSLLGVDGGYTTPGLQFNISPTPTSAENGQIVSKEYISNTCILPKQWITATAFGANSYCSNAGNVYKTIAGGTTGATAPTHTSGAVSDGTVTWAYQGFAYDRFLADTDFPILSHKLVKAGIKWRFLMENGLEFGIAKTEYDELLQVALAGIKGGRDLNMVPNYDDSLLGYDNIPDRGYGS
jgi:hypothetical protein